MEELYEAVDVQPRHDTVGSLNTRLICNRALQIAEGTVLDRDHPIRTGTARAEITLSHCPTTR